MGGKRVNSFQKSLRSGDTAFFEALYADHFENLCVYLLNFTSDKQVISDIVQDSFLYLWTNRKKIIITDSVKSYLYKMAYNKLMDFFRKRARKLDALQSYHKTLVDEVVQMESNVKEEQLNKLNECIRLLPKKCKEVFYNKKIKGLKSKQIASDLKISIKTVEAHITKAYVLLRACFKEEKV